MLSDVFPYDAVLLVLFLIIILLIVAIIYLVYKRYKDDDPTKGIF